jgi:hypothetical protein
MEEASSVLDQVVALIVIILIVGVFVAIGWGMVSAIARRKARKQHLISLGYTPLESQPPELMERLTHIYPSGAKKQKLELRNVFQQSIPGGQAFLFDLVDTGGEENNWLGTQLMGIVSPSLRLPHFMLQPWITVEQSGRSTAFLVNLADKVVNWAASTSGLARISFADSPAFEERFKVFGSDEVAVRRFLSTSCLAQLASLERPYKTEAAGDMFTIVKDTLSYRNKVAWEEEIEWLGVDAQKILAWFQANSTERQGDESP